VTLAGLIAPTRRLALVGLAKNTGKTETLAAILREHAAAARCVGVTSIGRDGEERDVIDARIAKPRVRLAAGDLVATTDALLRASALEHKLLSRTGFRTPLGEVLIARLSRAGAIEVAGPSAAEDVRAVSDSMVELGAEQVLIDGAIDRRAASSPAVADGLVIATGAILSEDIEQVVARTADAVELVRLPRADDTDGDGRRSLAGERRRSVADTSPAADTPPADDTRSVDDEHVRLERQLVLSGEPAQIAALLRDSPRASTLLVDGALSERLLEGLLGARRERAGRELRVVAGDPTKVFLPSHGPGWYRRQGIIIEVLRPIELRAITVNPVAPQSHHFESQLLRHLIEEAVGGDVPVFDVLDPSYGQAGDDPR
jgi:hypothetical protein